MEFNHRDLMEGSLGSTAFFCFCCICSRDRNTGTMHFCRGGIQINFIIFLFQFVNIYVGSRITITPFSFIIAVLFFFLILSHVYPFCFFSMGIIPVRGPFKHDESINFELKHLCTFYTYVFHLAFCIIPLPVYSVLCVVEYTIIYNNLQRPVTMLNLLKVWTNSEVNNFLPSSTFSFNVMKLTLMSFSQEKGWLSVFDLLYIKEDAKVFWP